MKGGINKIIRNIAATSGKSDFDKVLSHQNIFIEIN